jgi:integrase
MSMQRTKEGFFRDRIRAGTDPETGKGRQLWVTLHILDEPAAKARFQALRTMSQALTAKGLSYKVREFIRIAEEVPAPTEHQFQILIKHAMSLAPEPLKTRSRWVTFKDLAESWVTGELARLYPDHVKGKKTSDRDAGRLRALYATVGDVPLNCFTLAHALKAMQNLPATTKRPASRRHYAQIIAKVLRYAEFPCEICSYPLPKGFLPRIPKGDVVFPHLYPSEDLQLLRSTVALPMRVLIGLINREGLRTDEALCLEWVRLDREHGIINTTGVRKNGRVGSWPASPGTLDGLWAALRDQTSRGPFETLPRDGKYAERVRDALLEAGVSRPELFESGEGRRKLRAHDLRATFVTLALARGKSEAWIMRRTGHLSSGQVQGYNHAADNFRELERGDLMPLDEALGVAARGSEPPPPAGHVPVVGGQSVAAEALAAAAAHDREATKERATLATEGGVPARVSANRARARVRRGETKGETKPLLTHHRENELSPVISSSSPSRIRTEKPSPAGDFKDSLSTQEPHGRHVSAGNHVDQVGRSEALVSPLSQGVRQESTQNGSQPGTVPAVPDAVPGTPLSSEPFQASPAAADPNEALVASLRAAAHAAVVAGDWATVSKLGALIDAHKQAAPVAPVAPVAPAPPAVVDLAAARARREGGK